MQPFGRGVHDEGGYIFDPTVEVLTLEILVKLLMNSRKTIALS